MRPYVCLMLLLVLLVPLSAPEVRAQDACAGLLAPRLSVGGAARVLSGYGLSLKDQPMTGAAGSNEVTQLAYHTVASVQSGPRCNNGYIWWQIALPDGTNGWAAEGNNVDYFLEPYSMGAVSYQKLEARVVRFFVTPDGMASIQTTFNVASLTATPGDSWQQVELDALHARLADVQQNCPQRFKGTIWEAPDVLAAPDAVVLPALDYSFVPSPDGNLLLLVRNLTLDVPRCESVLPEKMGMNRVSLLSIDGTERELFPYPQHGTVPASEDHYTADDTIAPNEYLDEIVWSPGSKYIAFVAAYRDRCDGADCYRFHMYVYNLGTGQLYVPGEGRHVGWTNGGEGLNFFRLILEPDGVQRPHLYTMRPDGANREEVWLPGGAIYISTTQTDFGYPWNESGTRVMVGNAGAEQVMLLKLADRAFTPPVVIPDSMPQVNRLSINLMKGETTLLWTTIRGEFVVQDVQSGDWTPLNSSAATTGIAPRQVVPLANGTQALIELVDGSAYLLDINMDTLTPVAFGG